MKNLPLDTIELQKAWEIQEQKEGGLSVLCGHDFWKQRTGYGDIVYCKICHQFFVKVKGFPWIVRNKGVTVALKPRIELVKDVRYEEKHTKCSCFIPITPRLTEGYDSTPLYSCLTHKNKRNGKR